MRFGSVCSGIEAASVAWNPIGFEAAWLAEIEPFPCALLAHHYPDVPNLGDMTTIAARVAAGEVEAPDLFCGGTPCQAFSVAGLRNSLDDARGNLSLTFCEIADAVDAARSVRGLQPTIVFWENVPGVLNTKDNAFGCFLAGLSGYADPLVCPGGKWTSAGLVIGPKRTVAWRVLDAQYFGVAQRRRRVFVVASAREGFDPTEVLFEFKGVRRDTAPSRQEGKEVAGTIAKCSFSGGAGGRPEGAAGNHFVSLPAEVATTLDAHFGDKQGLENQHINGGATLFVPSFGVDCFNGQMTGDVTCTITSGGVTDAFSPSVMVPAQDPAHPLGACPGAYRSYGDGQFNYITQMPVVAFHVDAQPDQMNSSEHTAATLTKSQHAGVAQSMQVRRLTPRECERLQGFPDDYTLVPHRNKPAADGPRYKALGNSWAVPVVRWIGERIKAAL